MAEFIPIHLYLFSQSFYLPLVVDCLGLEFTLLSTVLLLKILQLHHNLFLLPLQPPILVPYQSQQIDTKFSRRWLSAVFR
jgi:hypothetical protein